MARITSQEANRQIGSQFDLILVASRRVRELRSGHAPQIANPHRSDIVTALREIEQGKVGRDYLLKNPNVERDTRRRAQ